MWNRNHLRKYGNHSSRLMFSITLETFISSLGYWQVYYGLETTMEDFMVYASLEEKIVFRYLTSDTCELPRGALRICSDDRFFYPQGSAHHPLSWELSLSYSSFLWIFNIYCRRLYCIFYLLLTLVPSLMF